MTARRRALVADATYLVGGALLVASGFVHWVARGAGSGLRGHRLVDTIVAVGHNVPALSGARLAVLWYTLPALGAAAWIACGIAGARHRAARIVAIAAVLVAAITYAAFARLVGAGDLGWGPKIALAGALLTCVGAWLPGVRGARAAQARSDTMAVPGL